MKRNRYHYAVPTLLLASIVLFGSGCEFKAAASLNGDLQNNGVVSPTQAERFKFFIRGKKTSNLSEDRKTITLSIDAVDPDGGELSVEWGQDKAFGSFNSTKGKDVQWTATREGDYQVTLTATVRGSVKSDDPDIANFVIPVVDGKIKATEIAPEITVAPQSLILFHSLPTSLSLTDDQLKDLGVLTKAQLTATTYIYDAATNTKVKQSGDFNEIKWLSGDAAIAVVDDNGLVRPAPGSAVGTSIVTATSKTNSASKAAIPVMVKYLDTKINLTYPTTTIYLNGQGTPNTVTIGATLQYTNPTDRDRVIFSDPNGREITWSSSNQSIAQVDTSGKVTPLADAATGDVTITATSNYDPSKTSSVVIKVRGTTQSNVQMIAQ